MKFPQITASSMELFLPFVEIGSSFCYVLHLHRNYVLCPSPVFGFFSVTCTRKIKQQNIKDTAEEETQLYTVWKCRSN